MGNPAKGIDFLGRYGKELIKRRDFPQAGITLLHKPVHAVKGPSDWAPPVNRWFGVGKVTMWPQEGNKKIWATAHKNETNIPRFIWMKIEDGKFVGWRRAESVQRSWAVLRRYLRKHPAIKARVQMGGKSA